MLRKAIVIAFALLALGTVRAQGVQTFEGTGSAIMGSGMTIEQTRKLALDAAKRNALEKFGSFVHSEEIVGENRIAQETRVISASVTRVKEKEVTRKVEGNTFRFVVNAKFEIDVGGFRNQVKALSDAPENVQNLVDRATRIESRIRSTQNPAEKQALQLQSLSLREEINKSMQRIGGSRLQSAVSRSRKQKQRAVKRHVRFIRQHARPYSLVSVRSNGKPQIRDKGEYVKIQASYEVIRKEAAKAIGDSLRSLANRWHTENGYLPENPDFFRQSIVVAFVGTGVGGDVKFVEAATQTLQFDYMGGTPIGKRDSYDFKVGIPHKELRSVENINMVITKFGTTGQLRTFLRKQGFEVTTPSDNRTYFNADSNLRLHKITVPNNGRSI